MRSLPSILKYFMKPKAEEYELPDEEQLVSQLEEMIRLKENVPSDDAAARIHVDDPGRYQ